MGPQSQPRRNVRITALCAAVGFVVLTAGVLVFFDLLPNK